MELPECQFIQELLDDWGGEVGEGVLKHLGDNLLQVLHHLLVGGLRPLTLCLAQAALAHILVAQLHQGLFVHTEVCHDFASRMDPNWQGFKDLAKPDKEYKIIVTSSNACILKSQYHLFLK